ncbi:hypothetical protein PENSPDRAFT_749507 [Peniophora sp. CONT]|nr:hypothetical protein PENSPDRAFT_749507 [Peniophora sp. CONT]
MDSPSPRRSRPRLSAIAQRSEEPPSPRLSQPRPSRVPTNRERSVPPTPKSAGTPKSPPPRIRQSTYAAPSSQFQVLVDPPPPSSTDTPNQTPKRIKRRATITRPTTSPASPKLKPTNIGRPVSDASPTTSSIARPVRMARASLPLIQIAKEKEDGEAPIATRMTLLPPIPTSPPVGGSFGELLTLSPMKELGPLQLPSFPQTPESEVPARSADDALIEDSTGDGPTLTSEAVLARIDAEIAFGNEALEKINGRIAQIYELKVDLRRQVRMSRTM